MKKVILALFLLMDIFAYPQSYHTIKPYVIPAGGATVNPNLFDVYNVSAANPTNLGANNYTIAFAAVPAVSATWEVQFDATYLTVSSGVVTLFGVTPLTDYPYLKKFVIDYLVTSTGTVSYHYVGAPFASGTVSTLTVTGATNLYGVVKYQQLLTNAYNADSANLRQLSDSTVGRSCTGWCTLGNAGTVAGTDFVGTTDNIDLVFKVNSQKAGLINIAHENTGLGYQSLNALTSGLDNTAIGYQSQLLTTTPSNNTSLGAESLRGNTTGGDNTGIGWRSLWVNTTGASNIAVGSYSLVGNTTGSRNTAIGENALFANTTGNNNTAIGENCGTVNTTGTLNTYLGYQADANANNYSNSTGLGANALILGNNILAIAPAVRSISFTGHSTGVGYGLRDSSGDGTTWIPMPNVNTQTLFTPLTGDSITITTQANIIVPAGTIANLTIQLPASPFNGQVENFSFTQVVSAIHWSTALNQANNVVATVPTAATPAGYVFSIQFNTATSKWYNY